MSHKLETVKTQAANLRKQTAKLVVS